MLVLTPQRVRLDGLELGRVQVLAVERVGERVVVEWSDGGPHPTFADVPQVRTIIRIEQELEHEDEAVAPVPGVLAQLRATFAAAATSSPRRELRARVVVIAVSYDLWGRKAPMRRIECAALSGDGGRDPIELIDVS